MYIQQVVIHKIKLLGFENLKEFIAECIMAAELTDKISLANKVKARIR